MKEAFEKWWEDNGIKSNGFYSSGFDIIEQSFKEIAWKAWQASWEYYAD